MARKTKEEEEKCMVCNIEIEWLKSPKYLGDTITYNNKSYAQLQDRRLATFRSYHAVNSQIEIEGENLD